MDNIFTKLIAFLKGEVTEIEQEVSDLEAKLLPGIEAALKKLVAVFGEQALTIAEQLGAAIVTGIETGENPGVLIPQLVNDALKDLAPALLADAKNALYTVANLALAEVPAAPVASEKPADETAAPAAPVTDGQAIS